MFIAIIAGGYPQDASPLNGIFEFDQAKALQEHGHKIVYIALDLRPFFRRRKLGFGRSCVSGIDVFNISIPIGGIPQRIKFAIGKILLNCLYIKVIRLHGKPDIIHSHFYDIGYISTILKEKYNIPLVHTEHSSQTAKVEISSSTSRICKTVYSSADCVLAVSSSLGRNINEQWGIKPFIIPNIVDISIFRFGIKQESKNFVFTSIGHLIEGKGFDILIEAFKNANFNKTVHLKIIGQGPDRRKIQKLIDKYGLRDQVFLMGFLKRIDISDILCESDAFVLASRGETFGVVYIEALLSGLPVIATTCGGPEDFIDEHNGILVPNGNISLLSESLMKMHKHINRYNRKSISENCFSRFGPQTISNQLTQIYKMQSFKNKI